VSLSENDKSKIILPVQENRHCHSKGFFHSKISSFFVFSEKLSSSASLKWSLMLLLPVLILLKYPVDGIDNDVWWQIAHGKYYVSHHALKMDFSIFSWTNTNPTWIYNTCLGSIVLYLLYNFMGGFGLWLLQWLIFGGTFLCFYFFLRLLKQRLDINNLTVIAAIGMACSISCCYYRPELFSVLFLCWVAFVFFYIKITHRKYLFYLYPFIFALWVNLHGAFIMGLAFLVMAFTGEFLNRIFFPQKSFTIEELNHFGIALILSGVATLLNPYGMNYLLSVLRGLSFEYNRQNIYVLANQSLWPLLKDVSIAFFMGGLTAWLMTFMIASVFIVSIYELIKNKSCDLSLLIISMALYWKGMEMNRASYFLPVVFFFIFFYSLIARLDLEKFFKKATVFSLLIFTFFMISTVYLSFRYGMYNHWFGNGLDEFAPKEEVAFLKKYKLEGPIFNDYLKGGYLIWDLYPDYKVFIDPRCGLYLNQVFPDYIKFTSKHITIEDINYFRKKYPFKIVILPYGKTPLIFDFLKADNEWHFLYSEKNAVILVHKSLLPDIRSKIGFVDTSPLRFRDVKHPDILLNIFNFYVRLDTGAGQYIYKIFKMNVSDYYKFKPDILKFMETEILKRKTDQERIIY
jgi:hypothetical protein